MATVTRGCGDRQKGGCYLEVPLSKHGLPLEHFLCCPPITVDANELGISPIGVKLVERSGAWHVLDWVGKQYYPNVADFVEETRRFGISRRVPKNLDFKKLTSESRLILLHERAWHNNFAHFKNLLPCPKDMEGHIVYHEKTPALPEMCISLWWQDLEGGEKLEGEEDSRSVRRVMPSFEYNGFSPPEDVKQEYQLAIFGSFPIPRIVVINDPESNTHVDSLAKAQAANIPVRLVDE